MAAEICLESVSQVFVDRRRGDRTEALKDVTFTLSRHETVALLGPSGCGKSTVLNVIAGFIQPTSGHVRIDGVDIQSPGPDRGVVFQEHFLFHWLTVEDNVAFALKMAGVGTKQRRELAREYVKRVGLEGFERHHPDELSGGMKQRVAIARVLINNPRVLLMDEPFAALDAQTRLLMQEWLLALWEEQSMSMLFITHDIDEAILVADRILVMGVKPGRIIQEVKVPLARPRVRSALTSAVFMETKRICMEAIVEQSAKAFAPR
jgi:ABC-type nitrate/sulfonate/bicarbonate transport system ATPase subunit